MTGAASVGSGLERVERVAGELRAQDLDMLLVSAPLSLRYLLGFTGTHGVALVAAEGASAGGSHRFLTDFRYETQAGEQIPGEFEREIVTGSLLEAAAGSLRPASGRLGFEEASLTVADHARLRGKLASAWELHAAWPGSELVVVDDAGHSPAAPGMTSALVEATDRFAVH